jgi:perosamine synthetase
VINVSKPSISITERKILEEVLESGWIGQGQKVFAFEEKCKEELQAKHFIALSSCTKSLEIGLIMADCVPGDEVIVPSLTYASVIQVIIKLGLVPVFATIEKEDLNISVNGIERLITPKTKAILPLHFRGHSCQIDAIQDIAARHGLKIVEDAAHAFGSSYKGSPVGSTSFLSCFSFGPLKNICCIEGGGIATNDDEIAEKIMTYRNMGMSRSTWHRYNSGGPDSKPWHYEVVAAGDKCTQNDVGAAVGLMQLGRISEIRAKKKKIIERYLAELPIEKGMEMPAADPESDFAYIFCVLANAAWREKLMAYLWDKGISTAVHYYPNHLQPYFAQYNRGGLPVTEDAGKRIITLPSYTDLSESDQSYVIDEIKKFVRQV